MIRPEIGPDAGLYLWWYFYNVHRWRYSISGQEGRLVRLDLRYLGPGAGRPLPDDRSSWRRGRST